MNIRRLWHKPGKLGRSAKGTLATPLVRDTAVQPLALPPSFFKSPHPGKWWVLRNDVLGCCVISGLGHVARCISFILKEKFSLSDAQVDRAYYRAGIAQGGTPPNPDNGLSIDVTLTEGTQESDFFIGQIAAFAALTPSNLHELQQGIVNYGMVIVGGNIPQSAEDQFPKVWRVVPNSPIVGGHCWTLSGYDDTTALFDAETWGVRIKVTYDFIATYVDEAYVCVPSQIVRAGAFRGRSAESLIADMTVLS